MTNRRNVNVGRKQRGKRSSNAISNSTLNARIQRIIEKSEEQKVAVTTSSGALTAVVAGTALTPLSQSIIQGITGYQRIGDTIKLKHINFTFTLSYQAGATVFTNMVRYIMVIDKINNGTAPVTSDLLDGVNVTSNYSNLQIKEQRFHIIIDKVVVLSLNGPSGYFKQHSWKFNNDIFYNAVTSVTAANGKGSVWMLALCDQAAFLPIMNYDVEMLYCDS